jgi:hypothetical protein
VRIPACERENFRLNKGNIFPSRKSLVSDIPAEEGKTAKPFFYGVVSYRLCIREESATSYFFLFFMLCFFIVMASVRQKYVNCVRRNPPKLLSQKCASYRNKPLVV